MRYFTRDLYRRMNSCDEQVRLQAECEWRQNVQEYKKVFDKAKRHMPLSFLREYEDRQGFHDCSIDKIVFSSERNKHGCELYSHDKEISFCLTLIDVRRICADANLYEHRLHKKLIWGESELEWTDDKTIRLSIVCDLDSELQFECKAIKFTRTK